MKNYLLIIFIFICSCNGKFSDNEIRNNFIFSDEMTFDEFKLKLEEYAKNSPYPNPDD